MSSVRHVKTVCVFIWDTIGSNGSTTMAKAPNITLKVGDQAPDFSSFTIGGMPIRLKDYAGKRVVLYFYPKDDTPGCTKEACGFRDLHEKILLKNTVVLGVSTDSVKVHEKFTGKYELPFPLIADTDKRIVEAYGVWGEKSFMGRRYMGTHRVTFLIGPDGSIKQIWTEVKAAKHPEEVLLALESC